MRLIDADSIKYHRTTECGGHGVFVNVDMVYKEEIDAIPTIDPGKPATACINGGMRNQIKRNEVIDELIKLRQRCARLKCAPNGRTEEWARSEDALGFAINALRHMQYGEWIFRPDGKVKNWGEIVCSRCGMPIAFGGEWALQKAREKNHWCPSCGAEMEADET